MPDSGTVGTLLSLAPAAGPIGHLLRTAIDAEQVGATRLHLPAEQPDLPGAVAALREHTTLVLTCDTPVPGADSSPDHELGLRERRGCRRAVDHDPPNSAADAYKPI